MVYNALYFENEHGYAHFWPKLVFVCLLKSLTAWQVFLIRSERGEILRGAKILKHRRENVAQVFVMEFKYQ